jgi:hypothetical protein
MFDFDRWCSWAEAETQRVRIEHVTVEFHRGKPSPKRGATVDLKTGSKLLQLAFWETGEADFYGLDVPTGKHLIHFFGRVLDDASFEQTFRECLAAAA